MRIGRFALGVATLAAAATLGAGAPPAQAQELCFTEDIPVVGGTCVDPRGSNCVEDVCVPGIGHDGRDVLEYVVDRIPDTFCPPTLSPRPVCFTIA